MRLNFVPLVTALLPTVAVHVCYLMAANLGHVSWCFPYFPDCVSISATGRHAPESFVFRAAIIPTAVLMMIYWKLGSEWLKTLATPMTGVNRTMMWLGMTAGLGLFVYAIVLGEVGELYRLQRRVGMIVFYILTYLAQLLMTIQVVSVARTRGASKSTPILVAISGAVTVLGAMSLLSWAFYEDYRRYEDAFEWGITLLILAHPLAIYFAWRQSGYRARLTVSDRRS
ncbi:MAG: hypothetical protein QGI13_01935 [Rhodospirillales bacterium]|nr:hypothetical protein [Rhodospirillales bacterium]